MRNRFSASIAALAIAGSVVAAPQALAQENTLTGGQFAWPFKQSLIDHLQGAFANGEFSTTKGVEFVGNQFVFTIDPAKTKLDSKGNGTIELDGQATLRGYPGMGPNDGWGLDATYSDLKLVIEGTNVQVVGDYDVTGDQGGKGVEVDKDANDVVISTFTLAKAITPGTDAVEIDRPSAAGEGMVNSMGRYSVGEDLKTPVDLILDYDDGKEVPKVQGTELEGIDKLSSDLRQSSSKEGEEPFNLMGLIIGLTATVGVLGVVAGVAAAALNGVIPGVDAASIRQTLAGMGIKL